MYLIVYISRAEDKLDIIMDKKDKKDGKKQVRISDVYKQVRDTGTWVRFMRKDMNKETPGLTDEELDSASNEFGLTAESIEDLLRL